MEINKINNFNFTARNHEIKKAQQIIRIINLNFPSYSNSKYERFNNINKNPMFRSIINFKAIGFYMNVRQPMEYLFHKQNSVTKYYEAFLKTLKRSDIVNCAEFAELAKLVFGLNGKNLKYAEIIPESVGHAVGVIPAKSADLSKIDFEHTPVAKLKDVIIVDPWLGDADYAPNMAIKYESEFSKFIGKYNNTKKANGYYLKVTNIQPHDVDESIIEHFRKTNPELFIK